MSMEYNKQPISMREGKVFIDGVECMDSISCKITANPDVWKGKLLGERAPSARWLGHEYIIEITRRRTTTFGSDIVKNYMKSGKTPEMTIQGVMNDKGSDFFESHGNQTVTVYGCVPTSGFDLIQLDSGGEVVEDKMTLNGKELVM